MAFGSWSLRAQVGLVFGSLVTLVCTVLVWTSNTVLEAKGEEAIGVQLSSIASNMADKFDRGMMSRISEIAFVSSLDLFRNPSNPRAIRHTLDDLQEAVPYFTWIGFTDPTGTVRAATNGLLEGADLSQRAVFQQGIQGPFTGDVHEAPMLAKALGASDAEPMRFLDITFPVTDLAGAAVGMLSAHIDWAWARELEQAAHESALSRQGLELLIVDHVGTVLLHPEGITLPKTLDIKALLHSQTRPKGWTIETWPDGKVYLTGYARQRGYKAFPGFGWRILTRQPVEVAFAPLAEVRHTLLLAGVVGGVIFGAIGWITAGAIARPLKRITVAADGLRDGAVGVTLPRLTGSKEIERLSESLRLLINALTATDRRMGRMERLAHNDLLTGLPNRAALGAHLDRIVPAIGTAQAAVAFLYLDLDGFKAVNDTLGHGAGDELLKAAAGRILECLRQGDMAARLGGDEFVVIVNTSASSWRQESIRVADRLLTALDGPFALQGGVRAKIGCSIGIAAWPDDHCDIEGALHHADIALYQAKRLGKGQSVVYADIPKSAVHDG
ncbi:diguanylate cyclase [Rhodospirillum rubrum]|uniref:sensor domain-containing diguanylate cyclase n=1 Tax=Rhodospirillum rubrum TaxID=1085 RepID=UPI0019046A98|nr:sensor domain-containing diguanylate cyclase [Rhodospirillum rubrum]MBK1663874.1 diguanylate cyclase [Rhodospirillum rubrum]MBK1675882.1 diguanylate cyclase [Rhodospirillum rubrum]